VKKLVMAAAVASLGVAGLAVPAASAAPVAAPTVDWKICDPKAPAEDPTKGVECAQLPVPLDYAKPNGKKISIAITRRKHTGPDAQYQGVLIANPGGPGGSGTDLAGSLPQWFAGVGHPEIGRNYDVIGFDPRGVGASVPALTCNAKYQDPVRPDYVPSSKKDEARWLAKSKAYAKACQKKFGWLLPHLKTTDAARDLDSLRLALGQEQINYYGFSYGTYLGSVYATLFPTKIRRMVFDGNVGPKGVWYDAQLEQDKAFERNFKLYAAWIAKYDKVYHLGKSAKAVQKKYYQLRAKAKKRPFKGTVGPDELDDTVLNAGYSTGWYAPIATALADLNKGKPGGLVSLYNGIIRSTGDNSFAMYNAVQAADAKWPRSWKKWKRDAVRTYKVARFNTWNNVWFNAPALYWPFQGGPATKIRGKKGLAPFLMVQSTLDAATPYKGALELHKLLPSSRLLVEVGGKTHSNTLNGNKCLDDKVAAYLNTGALPAARPGNGPDAKCGHLPDFDPTADSTRSQSADARAMTVFRP
jgi:pimeloyl-ACP methyl ester carboxylesterase